MESRSRVTRALTGIVCLQIAFGPQAVVLAQAADVVLAPVPADAAATVGSSANGTPVLNISAPNSAGVSHNRFTSYDVDARGLVINNSAANAVSLIGGGTPGNANLASGAANLILNEVVTANAGSVLNGYQEILGQSAELVIANPWGITCNGCGFVNTPRVTLSTGTPMLSASGALQGFTITGGLLAVTGEGLDATRQTALDLLARNVRVDGNIVAGSSGSGTGSGGAAGDLRIFAGAGQFDYATRAGSALPAGAGGAGGPAPQFAIDSSALGGMYADRIRLLVTEQGAGVRVAGDLAALGEDLTLAANGRIELRGATSAARDLSVQGTQISVSLPNDDTYVYGGRDLSLSASDALDFSTGAIGAARNVAFSGSSLTDVGGADSLRFAAAGGSIRADIGGLLDLRGGLWHSPRISLSSTSALFGNGTTLSGSGTTGSSLDVTTAGSLSINGGELYSAADASLTSNRLEVDADGVVAADGALAIRASGASGGSALVNRGDIVGGEVTIAMRDTSNLGGVIQGETQLDLQSDTLQNVGATAQIIGSTTADGTASIDASSVTNSGTIWSTGDLTLSPTTLTQQREAGATSNPLIGAGRDLTIAYTGNADLSRGDLQAGRDLTITGTSINDFGAPGTVALSDVRYAGRNLVATAAPGGNVYVGGGNWFSQGDLRLTGDDIFLGSYLDRAGGFRAASVDVALAGAWGGTGTVALNARSGGVTLDMDASVFSGNDVTLWQQDAFTLNRVNVLQSSGLLSIQAGGAITNLGTIVGGTVELGSSNGVPLDYLNGDTGVLAGDTAVRIGLPTARAGLVRVLGASTSVPRAGIYGGGLDIDAVTLENYGLMQGVGPYSNIDVDTLFNDVNGRIMGFTNTSGVGGLGIGARTLWNRGLLYDSSVLHIAASSITNYETGALAGPGILRIYTDGIGGPAGVLDNIGEIWGGEVELSLFNGLRNGRDPANIANRLFPSSIYATQRLTVNAVGAAPIINHGRIESEHDIRLFNVGTGQSQFENSMSKVTDAELTWSSTAGGSPRSDVGHLGLLAQNPESTHTGWTDIDVNGMPYYRFTDNAGDQYAYLDRTETNVQFEQIGVPIESLRRPTVRAGGNLTIDGFGNVLNYSGSLGAVGDVSITSLIPGSSVTNTGWRLGSRNRIDESVTRAECLNGSNQPEDCSNGFNHVQYSPFYSNTRYEAASFTRDGLRGLIYAGGTLSINVAGTVTNAGTQGPFTAIPKTGPGQATGVSVTGPGATGARNGATSLNLNGAAIPLPQSANGRFVNGQGSGTGPLVETNPLFGLDSINLGSEYLAKLLGLKPEEQARRLGDDNYEGYLIQEQVQAATGRGVLAAYWSSGDMVKTLFDNAADEATRLDLGYGKALTPEQIASLKSDIVWMVEQEVKGQKVLIPVVYLTDATRATVATTSSIEGYNVDIKAGTVSNAGGNIAAANSLRVGTTGNIENISGRIAGWNVRLDAGGDLVNSTLVKRDGTAGNGTDVAQRAALIEAGNTAVLKAGRDINVSGAWVTAGKDAALIAGRNVNVESVALAANAGGTESWNRQTQTALGGGVAAGGNLGIQAGQDVNVKGAHLAADDTAVIRAERDVNIGVLELTDKTTSTAKSTHQYNAADLDRGAGTLGLGGGVEKTKVTQTTTTTVGVGSSVAGGEGVVISTGKGDVNITGSAIEAGAGPGEGTGAGEREDDQNAGIVIDSARNVNIAAYNDKTETETTTDTFRAGVAIDLSTDGAFAGTAQSGNKTTDTTTQTTARTSSLTSGGKVVIRGKGDVTNEGTQIDAAGDVVMAGENVINKAARDTYTTSSTTDKWEAKQQQGITTNGTGSSIANAAKGKGNQVTVANVESQVRLTGSGSTETTTASSTQARGTSVKAGGNVIVVAKNKASDEGTQYEAGKDIIVSAGEYENKAAADTTGISTERTYASGKLTAGVNTSAEVAMTASAEGGYEKSSETTSTAKTGSMKAGGNVIIVARSGDVTLEGTQIDGKMGVGISATGDVNLNQANNTTTKKSSSESGSARLSGSVSLLGTGGSVGAGASARVAQSEETSSTAVTGNIRSGAGNVQIDAGRDLKSQGTGIDAAGNVALSAARDIDLAAATDTVRKTGSVDAGGVDANVGFGTGAAKGNGGVGVTVDFERSRTDYTETTEKGSNIKAGGTFSVNAGRDARLEGTQVDANDASLKTGGNLLIESAQHTVKDDSYSVSGRIEASASKGGGMGGASTVGQGGTGGGSKGGGNAGGGNAQVDVKRSYQDIETNTNATINTRGGTTVKVGGDMTLAGANLNAQGGVTGEVAGNLNIETRVDKEIVDQQDVKTYAGAGPVGGLGGTSKVDRGQNAVQAGANNIAQTGAFVDVSSQKKDNLTVGTQSGINGGAGGIDLEVGGNTTLKGAANAGTDFRTQGQTTIESVETRTSSSSIDNRVAGTVSTLAGSDKGKGGDYGLNVATPSKGAKTADDATPPRAQGTWVDGVTPTTPRRGAKSPPADVDPWDEPARPANVPYANGTRPSTVPYANGTRPSTVPYANGTGAKRARSDSGASDVPDPSARPSTVPYSNGARPNRPRVDSDAGDAPVASSKPYANGGNRPRSDSFDAPDSDMDARQRRPSVVAPNADDWDAPANPPQRVALVDQRAAEKATQVTDRLGGQLNGLKDNQRFLDNDVKAARRNLREIDAFARQKDPATAQKLLEQFERSMKGPAERDGFKEYPVMPPYVGENVAGFDNWNSRRNEKNPGAAYAPEATRKPDPPVKYFSETERESARVYVASDGTLVDAKGNSLPSGDYIFVVDGKGRMIVTPWDASSIGKVHHSSLSGGEPVRMAGNFHSAFGKIDVIGNRSGHFRPDVQSFERFMADLVATGIQFAPNVRATVVEMLGLANGGTDLVDVDSDVIRTAASAPRNARSMLSGMKSTFPPPRRAVNDRENHDSPQPPVVNPGQAEENPYNSGERKSAPPPAPGGASQPPTGLALPLRSDNRVAQVPRGLRGSMRAIGRTATEVSLRRAA